MTTPSERVSTPYAACLSPSTLLSLTDAHPQPGTIQTDVLVIGGGIVGLWSAAVLARSGFSVLLVERDALGGGQTNASQGILHGGIKYTLSGSATEASLAVAEMPDRWRQSMTSVQCDQPDLRRIRMLSKAQYLWTTGSFFANVTAKVAAKVIRTSVGRIESRDACPGLQDAHAAVTIYRVDEPVIDPVSVVSALRDDIHAHRGLCVQGNVEQIDAASRSARINGRTARFSTCVLAAGAGNAHLVALLGEQRTTMQRRPLHMVMAHGHLPDLFGHCIKGGSDKPLLTVTTQRRDDGSSDWYLGGQLAEEGVRRNPPAQIDAAKASLQECLPWINTSRLRWSTLMIDRAEGLTPDGSRPDMPVVQTLPRHPHVLAVWPTKLVFAPLVGDMVLAHARTTTQSSSPRSSIAVDLPAAPIAPLPWQTAGRAWT